MSKLSSEHYLGYYKHQYGLDYTTLRYANIYGPRQIPHGEAGVIAIFMENLLKGKRSTLYHFSDDEAGMVRDYCYVGDVVKANLRTLENGSGEFFNIGTGHGTKTLALYKVIFDAFKEVKGGVSEELETQARYMARPGELSKSCLVVEKARRFLGWVPETDLKEGIHKTMQWRLNQLS